MSVMHFKDLNLLVQAKFDEISKDSKLFLVNVRKGVLWDHYLNNIPAEIRQEYNCNCCRSFINKYGGLVSVDPSRYEIRSIWDVEVPAPFDKPFKVMLEEVMTSSIRDPLVSPVSELGVERSIGTTWHHFYLKLSPSQVWNKPRNITLGTELAKKNSTYISMKIMFQEWNSNVIENALTLIENGKLERPDQIKPILLELQGCFLEYESLNPAVKDNYVRNLAETRPHLAIRSHLLGEMLSLLASSTTERAKSFYNRQAAPDRYQRTTSAPSARQVDKAKQAFEERGLMPSLERKLATIRDIPLSACLFVDRTANTEVDTIDPFGSIQKEVKKETKRPKGKPIGIEAFLSDVLPKANSVEVWVESDHYSNLSTFVAPVNPDSPNILAWDNNISYAFVGDAAGAVSIRQKVRDAGGSINGKLRISLSWGEGNSSDYDLKVIDPIDTICFSRKRGKYGYLDVDANAVSIMKRPVENIIYEKIVPQGNYTVEVNLYSKRREIPAGYTIEIAYEGTSYFITKNTSPGRPDKVASFFITKDKKLEQLNLLRGDLVLSTIEPGIDKENNLWGVPTGSFQKISHLILSPNYWQEPGFGNKQYFFILPNCQVQDSVRGFFKEFIKPDLRQEFGKVFEGLGSSTMIHPKKGDEQVTGLGLSANCKKTLIAKVDGKPYEVSFNYEERFKKEEEEENESGYSNNQSSREKAYV